MRDDGGKREGPGQAGRQNKMERDGRRGLRANGGGRSLREGGSAKGPKVRQAERREEERHSCLPLFGTVWQLFHLCV